jgi:hypothetical protein
VLELVGGCRNFRLNDVEHQGRIQKPEAGSQNGKSKFILAFGVKLLERAVIISLRHEDLRGAAQIAVVRRGGINKRLRGGDAVFFQHHNEHFGIHDRAGVK